MSLSDRVFQDYTTFCNLGQQMVRGKREIKSLDLYLQAFFDPILVFQHDFKLEAVAILRFKENYTSKNGRKGKQF